MDDRQKHLLKAKCADYSNDFRRMYGHCKDICKMNVELNEAESNFLGSSIRYIRNEAKKSLRNLRKLLDREAVSERKAIITEFIAEKIKELREFYQDVLQVLKEHIIPNSEQAEGRVYFGKLEGDMYRYLLELDQSEKSYEVEGKKSYESAMKVAPELDVLNTVRIGLVCNFSFFLFDFLKEKDKAMELARDYLEKTKEREADLKTNEYSDAVSTLEFLKKNLTIWEEEDEKVKE